MLKGKALVTYSNGRTYVSVNDKIKGYIDNTTIDGLMNVFKKETDTQQLVDGLDSLGGFIKGTDLEKSSTEITPYIRTSSNHSMS